MNVVESIKNGLKGALASRLADSKTRDTQAAAARKAARIAEGHHEQERQEYEAARKSILGEFSDRPITASQPCLCSAKAASRQTRLDLVGKAIMACPEHAETAARLRQDMDEIENMRCAKHVYAFNERPIPDFVKDAPPGFLPAGEDDLAQMGLDPEDLVPEGSNFRAAVYKKDPAVWGDNPEPPYVLAFRGTTPNQEDWDNNFAQDANNDAPYYKAAVRIGQALRDSGAKVHIVGHSLGGGLASAAQGASGLSASSYNSAGLNPATVPRYLKEIGAPDAGRNAEPLKIKAIRVEGEVLTQTLEHGFVGAIASDSVGTRKDIAPAVTEQEFNQLKAEGKTDEKEDYPTYLHGMDGVIESTEKQKRADQAALGACLARVS